MEGVTHRSRQLEFKAAAQSHHQAGRRQKRARHTMNHNRLDKPLRCSIRMPDLPDASSRSMGQSSTSISPHNIKRIRRNFADNRLAHGHSSSMDPRPPYRIRTRQCSFSETEADLDHDCTAAPLCLQADDGDGLDSFELNLGGFDAQHDEHAFYASHNTSSSLALPEVMATSVGSGMSVQLFESLKSSLMKMDLVPDGETSATSMSRRNSLCLNPLSRRASIDFPSDSDPAIPDNDLEEHGGLILAGAQAPDSNISGCRRSTRRGRGKNRFSRVVDFDPEDLPNSQPRFLGRRTHSNRRVSDETSQASVGSDRRDAVECPIDTRLLLTPPSPFVECRQQTHKHIAPSNDALVRLAESMHRTNQSRQAVMLQHSLLTPDERMRLNTDFQQLRERHLRSSLGLQERIQTAVDKRLKNEHDIQGQERSGSLEAFFSGRSATLTRGLDHSRRQLAQYMSQHAVL